MKNKGWVKLWRDQFNSWISKKPFCDGYAWSYLYSRANHKKGMVNFRNEYIEVERGQFLTSKLKLQEIFGWTYRHVGNFLKALENDENIGYRTTNRYIVITITNYEKYQGNEEQNDEQNGEQIRNRLGTEQEQIRNEATQTRINKNVKNGNNVKNKYMDVVFLTQIEYDKLIEELGELLTKEYIKDLSLYIQSKGKEKQYKSHYATILTWNRNDIKKGVNRSGKNNQNNRDGEGKPNKYSHLEEVY